MHERLLLVRVWLMHNLSQMWKDQIRGLKAELVWAQVTEQERAIVAMEERIVAQTGATKFCCVCVRVVFCVPSHSVRLFAGILERNEAKIKQAEVRREERKAEDASLAAELKLVAESYAVLSQDALLRDEALAVLRSKKGDLERKVVAFPKKIEMLNKRVLRLEEDMARALAHAGDDDAEQRARMAELTQLKDEVRQLDVKVGNIVCAFFVLCCIAY